MKVPRLLQISIPVLSIVAAGLLSGAPAIAQLPSGVIQDTVYRLDALSSVQDGCFPPCMCPVLLQDGLLGTFRLTPGATDPFFTVYDIHEVNWLVPGLGWRVIGSGTYRIGGEFALMHQLQFDLVVDGRQVQHYDSGLVLGGSSFPAIDLEVSMNSMICHDTVFRVVANPVFLNEIAPYALYHSRYEEGCFGPCDCPVRTQPIIGRFGLLKLGATNEGDAFAVLDIRWSRREASTPPATAASPIVGYGVYRTGAAGLDQRMILDLLEDGVGPTRFDSGHVPWDGDLRRIDVDLAADGFSCYDRVYSIYAKRRNAAITMFQAISTEPVSPGVVPLP